MREINQYILYSVRRFLQGEAFPLHFGLVDPCNHPKCGRLWCAIFVSGGLRSRYPLKIINISIPFPVLPSFMTTHEVLADIISGDLEIHN